MNGESSDSGKNATTSARVKAARTRADARLGTAIKTFLQECDTGAHQRKRPNPNDLVPIFEQWATEVFDAEAESRLGHAESPQAYVVDLKRLADGLVSEIETSTWRNAVLQASQDANVTALGGNEEVGVYDVEIFAKPRVARIRGALRLRVQYWESRAWRREDKKAAAITQTVPAAQQSPERISGSAAENVATGKTYKTTFGRNIDRFRLECGWSLNQLEEATGIDKKLIIGHISKGKAAHPKTQKKYADAFKKELKKEISVAELNA